MSGFNPDLMSDKFQVSGLPTAFAVNGSFGGAGATELFNLLFPTTQQLTKLQLTDLVLLLLIDAKMREFSNFYKGISNLALFCIAKNDNNCDVTKKSP